MHEYHCQSFKNKYRAIAQGLQCIAIRRVALRPLINNSSGSARVSRMYVARVSRMYVARVSRMYVARVSRMYVARVSRMYVARVSRMYVARVSRMYVAVALLTLRAHNAIRFQCCIDFFKVRFLKQWLSWPCNTT